MELLAPAGNWEAFLAAIENGADAVYLGGRQFSARQYADNFDLDGIRQAVEYAHVRERKVYVAVNTLIDAGELREVLDYVFELQQLGVDALIIQDIGLLSALRRVFPELRLHASTQMTVHNSEGVRFLAEKGISRVVLARELSERDIRAIRERVGDVELEVFAHGALCYSYSGQCLFSSVVGGRSGNRGRCAQPCRLAYRLRAAGGTGTNGEGGFVISPADLCLIEYLPAIQAAGVTSLKIEGRMKKAEYVATVTRVYRECLERLKQGDYRVSAKEREELAGIFNRNFTRGWWAGWTPGILSSTRPNNRGSYLGRIIAQDENYVTRIRLKKELRLGDGIEVWVGRGKNPGMVVREMEVEGHPVNEAGRGEEVVVRLPGRAWPGDRVFKTHDSRLVEKALQTIKANRMEGRVPVKASVELVGGAPLCITLMDEEGNQARACTRSVARTALTSPLTSDDLYEKVNRLGNTCFRLRDFSLTLEEGLMVPFSEVNEARRLAVARLYEIRLARTRPASIDRRQYLENLRREEAAGVLPAGNEPVTARPLLSVFVSRVEDARLALEAGADRVYLGLEGMGGRKRPGFDEVFSLRDLAAGWKKELILALPRITKPFDRVPWDDIARISPDGVLAGNLGAFAEVRKRDLPVFCDYSLNTFNPRAVCFWLAEGAAGVCLSPELSLQQLQNWPGKVRAAAEALVHGELVLMVSEYCPLRANLRSEGGESCRRVCQDDNFSLQDRKGFIFPLETDADCRAYLFNSRTLCMLEDLPRFLRLGFQSLRIEARRGSGRYIKTTVRLYRMVLDALLGGRKVDIDRAKAELGRVVPSEFTKIHYYRGVL